MLSVIDVIKSLTILIQENFPNYLVNDRDLEEGFERPSFFIDIAEVRGSTKTARYVTEYAELELFMFEKNIYQGFLNLLDAKNKILVLLQQPLKLTDGNNKTRRSFHLERPSSFSCSRDASWRVSLFCDFM